MVLYINTSYLISARRNSPGLYLLLRMRQFLSSYVPYIYVFQLYWHTHYWMIYDPRFSIHDHRSQRSVVTLRCFLSAEAVSCLLFHWLHSSRNVTIVGSCEGRGSRGEITENHCKTNSRVKLTFRCFVWVINTINWSQRWLKRSPTEPNWTWPRRNEARQGASRRVESLLSLSNVNSCHPLSSSGYSVCYDHFGLTRGLWECGQTGVIQVTLLIMMTQPLGMRAVQTKRRR